LSYINRLFLTDERKFQNNEPISTEYITKVQEKFKVAKALSIIELTELASDLMRIDAPKHTINLVEGLISQKNGNYKNACDKLYQAYSESGEWLIFQDFLSCFMETLGSVNEQSKYDVIRVIINSITLFIKIITSSTDSHEMQTAQYRIALLSCIIGKILFNSDETLTQKENTAKAWLEVVGSQNMIKILQDLLRSESGSIDTITSRFFGYLLACAGAENEVIQLHSGLNKKIKMSGNSISHLIDKEVLGLPSIYIGMAGFGTSPNILCDQLLTSQKL